MSRTRHPAPQLTLVGLEQESRSNHRGAALSFWIHAGLIAVAGLSPCGWHPAVQFQPSWVGVLWACLFLAGCLTAKNHTNQWPAMAVALTTAYLAWWSLCIVTDIPAAESMLVAVVLVVSGWSIASWQIRGKQSGADGCKLENPRNLYRWSMSSLGWLTTIVACAAFAIPRLQMAPWMLLCSAAVLISSVLGSWIACRWAWIDEWNVSQLAQLGLALLTVLLVIHLNTPSGLSIARHIQWALSGPISVVASQGLSVLLVLGLWRWSDRSGSC